MYGLFLKKSNKSENGNFSMPNEAKRIIIPNKTMFNSIQYSLFLQTLKQVKKTILYEQTYFKVSNFIYEIYMNIYSEILKIMSSLTEVKKLERKNY